MTEAPTTTPDFPIIWPNPDDAKLSWWHERWHLPDPITPLGFDYAKILYEDMNRGRSAKGEEGALRARRINTYVYITLGPSLPDDPAPIGQEQQPDRFGNHDAWDTLWLPEIQGYLARWRAFNYAGASVEELSQHIDKSLLWLARCWEIHDRLDFGPHVLFDLVQQVLGWTPEQAAELVLGTESKSLEGDNALRDLARVAADSPAVRQALIDLPPGEVLAALPDDPDTSAFRSALDTYLQGFGLRSDNFHDVSVVSWVEDPTSVISLLKLHVRETAYDAAAARRSAEARRAAAQQRVRDEFAQRAPDRLDELERELVFGLRANALNEDHNYWLDQQIMYWARMDMLAAANHLVAAGIIDARDDVFMLTLDQVRAGLVGSTGDLRRAVTAAREELNRWAGVTPPGTIGAPMPPEMKAGISVMFGRLDAEATETTIQGQPGAPGAVTGVARIVASLEDSHRLADGEILVTQTTSPPWTPLFGVAAAVVTDAGGPMSHVAIVAREYGIPAVVGAVAATRQIADGQRITVDGSTGLIELLDG